MSKARELANLGNAYSDGALSNRNLLINSAMQVAQRGTSQSIAHDGTTNAFVADRFKFFTYTMDQLDGTVAQVSDGPSGFPYSLKWTTGTAETTIDASEYVSFEYYVEAQDLQRLAYGTSSAQPLTLSFWVKSSVADDFGVSVYKGDGTPRVINLVYTINAADTWEYKTITFAGDTDSSGSIDNDNGTGFIISWGLAVGSTYNGDPNTTWGDYSSAKWLATQDQNTVITTAGATWQITGVQLEVGDTATPFEHRSYADELARCQRYFQLYPEETTVTGSCYNSDPDWYFPFVFPEMRAAPTVTFSDNPLLFCNDANSGTTSVTSSSNNDNRKSIRLQAQNAAVGSAGQAGWLQMNVANSYFTLDAEL